MERSRLWVLQDLVRQQRDPVQNVTEFIRKCRKDGMEKSIIVGAMMDQYHYGSTDADIIVSEFWDKTA